MIGYQHQSTKQLKSKLLISFFKHLATLVTVQLNFIVNTTIISISIQATTQIKCLTLIFLYFFPIPNVMAVGFLIINSPF